MIPAIRTTIEDDEVTQFSRIAEQWWDESGQFRPLHRMNPARISYIRDQVAHHFGREITGSSPFSGLTLADIGCGGGLITEPMVRLGFTTTGVDASERNIDVARLHAEQGGLTIAYRAAAAEALAAEGAGFDVVLALEIVEHVADVPLFLASCAALVKPGGLLIISTLNRTFKSLMLAKISAEYLLRWVPRGAHDWRKFLLPSEIEAQLAPHGLRLRAMAGLNYRPWHGDFHLNAHDLSVNYLMSLSKS